MWRHPPNHMLMEIHLYRFSYFVITILSFFCDGESRKDLYRVICTPMAPTTCHELAEKDLDWRKSQHTAG